MHTIRKNQQFSVIRRNGILSLRGSNHLNCLNKHRIPHYFGDRFIPRRYLLEDNEFNLKFAEGEILTDMLSNGPFKMQKDGYINTLKNLCGGHEKRILTFSDPTLVQYNAYNSAQIKSFTHKQQDWPCSPRKKHQTFKIATYALIETEVRSQLTNNMFDWSVHNEMAAAMGNNLLIWCLEVNEPKHYSRNNWNLNCLSYSPCGNFLAMGGKTIEYCERGLNKYTSVYSHSMSDEETELISLAWSLDGSRIVAGSSSGIIYVFDIEQLEIIRKLQVHNHPVECIKFSPNMRYMASGDTRGNIVIYNWDSCSVYVCIRSKNKINRNIKALFAFHPWNDTDLAIAESSPASLSIMHLPTRTLVAHYGRWDKDVTIDAISFNKITAELIVSFIGKDLNDNLEQRVHVFASLTKVVEVLQIPIYGVRFLMWSPDGTNLVTLSLQPAITIWKFCPKSELKSKIPKKKDLSPEMLRWTSIR